MLRTRPGAMMLAMLATRRMARLMGSLMMRRRQIWRTSPPPTCYFPYFSPTEDFLRM